MGVLSFRIKSKYLGFINYVNSIYCLFIIFSLINLSVCIYEDQIGKFDWRHTYVGKIKLAQFDTVSTAKKLIVATEENVLAALNLKTGKVIWRHVLETASQGDMQLLHVADKVITVSGSNPYLIRGWESNTGNLLWEWSLTLHYPLNAGNALWFVQKDMLYNLVPVVGSHLEITAYQVMTGQNRGSTSKLPASWVNKKCVLTAPYFACLSGEFGSELLLALDVTSDAINLMSKLVSKITNLEGRDTILVPLSKNSYPPVPGLMINDKAVLIKNGEFIVGAVALNSGLSGVDLIIKNDYPVLLQLYSKNGAHKLQGERIDTGSDVPDCTGLVNYFDDSVVPTISASVCMRTAKDNVVCRFALSGDDGSLHMVEVGSNVKEHWVREEAMSNIVGVEILDLPVSDLDAAIEDEFDQSEAAEVMPSNMLGKFKRRVHTQMHQLSGFIHSLVTRVLVDRRDGIGSFVDSSSSSALVRDEFGLHKVILVVTKVGKIFGLDNLSGEILWQRYIPQLAPVKDDQVIMHVRRTARHPPHDAHVSIVGSNLFTGNAIIVNVNPISGTLVGEGILELDYQVKQTALLAQADAEHLRALILLDPTDSVQVLPVSASPLIQQMFMFVADKKTTLVQGYSVKYDGVTVNAMKTWSILLGGSMNSDACIVAMVAKNPLERVHSQGKVMGDRSVLYKYVNPNLVAMVTESSDPVHKDVLNIFLVDVVSGAVVFSQSHRRARSPVHVVHSENWLVYAYYSDKQRRTEIATVELYEGQSRSVPPGEPFSSLSAINIQPLVERQSYILPATLTAMAETITEKGIASKHVLMSLSSGAILEMPWTLLDARRPTSPPTQEAREEGLLQYAPELPLPADAVLNYNRTVARIKRIHTAPSGLESTCLVFAYGLDIFYSRVAPSQTFDLLKDDFDYYLIVIVLVALTVASYSTKYFASRKLLKQAWK